MSDHAEKLNIHLNPVEGGAMRRTIGKQRNTGAGGKGGDGAGAKKHDEKKKKQNAVGKVIAKKQEKRKQKALTRSQQ